MILQNQILPYLKNVTGIIHVGAHQLEEKAWYDQHWPEVKKVWIDADVSLCGKIVNPKIHRLIHATVSDVNKMVTFYVASNRASSSILKPKKHLEKHPNVTFPYELQVYAQRLDHVLTPYLRENIQYNFINLDIQGAELKALQGMGNMIDHIDYIYTEVNTEELYEDCAMLYQMDEFLHSKGFERKMTYLYDQYGWGDAFYVRTQHAECQDCGHGADVSSICAKHPVSD
jgi:FkbM family methyltransferase